ncbi:MAG: RNA polymerase sigma factor RpoD/SigA [Planctomycetia bacterium]
MPPRDRALDAYLAEVRKHPLLTPAEEVELARRIQAHGEVSDTAHAEAFEAKERLEQCNLRLVIAVAKRYLHRGMPLPDLIEEGNIGLMHAAGKFDPTVGVRFSTYAVWWIKQSIRRAISNKVKTVRVPAYMAEEFARWRQHALAFERKHGRSPTEEEMVAAMQPPAGRKRMLLRLWRGGAGATPTVSLDLLFETAGSALEGHGDSGRPDLIEFPAWEQDVLHRHIDGLPPRVAEVIRLRFGLLGEPLSLRDVGAQLKLSREGARKLELRGLELLREMIETPAARRKPPARKKAARAPRARKGS